MKVCTKCEIQKPIEEFAWKNKAKGRLCSNCKLCQSVMRKDYYLRNKDSELKRIRDRKNKILTWYHEIKNSLYCNRCGENHPAVLQFHHTDPSSKEGNISQMVRDATSIKKIEKEVDKCEVLCANCHFKEHWKDNAPID